MPSIRDRIEQNLVVWLLTTLLTGFGAGMGAYRTIQEIGGLAPVSKSRYEDLQKKVETLEVALAESKARVDSLKSAGPVATAAPRSESQSDISGLKNVRVHIVHLPSQADIAARLAGEIETTGAIVSTFATNYDRSYWSINTKKDSEKGLVAAALLKSHFPGLGILPVRRNLSKEESNDLVIWLGSDYK